MVRHSLVILDFYVNLLKFFFSLFTFLLDFLFDYQRCGISNCVSFLQYHFSKEYHNITTKTNCPTHVEICSFFLSLHTIYWLILELKVLAKWSLGTKNEWKVALFANLYLSFISFNILICINSSHYCRNLFLLLISTEKNRVMTVAKPHCIDNMTFECQRMKYISHPEYHMSEYHHLKCKFTICRVNGSEISKHQAVTFAGKYHLYVATYVNVSTLY